MIVHIADPAAAARFASEVPAAAQVLMQRFWPGPLTLILRRRPGVATAAAGGQDTIGLRMPGHPLARALLQAAATGGVPGVAAPSANRFGRVSPTQARHVRDEFGGRVPVLDGGACPFGIESTIVDLSRGAAVLLRPGAIDRRDIEAALGAPLAERDDHAPRASGTLEVHYAPAARVRLLDAEALGRAQGEPGRPAALAVYSRTLPPPPAGVAHRAMPADAGAAAHELFAVLREWDAAGVQHIWVEMPPDTPDWEGVRDRLTRAAAS
ncbi:MAG TPA: L-threonylcarbamoyladenylate synthase [Gemmatimonadales bacterium]|nr:L-threonylcarbamoyladenylate synthase [Gemmatimonadales bacterium]